MQEIAFAYGKEEKEAAISGLQSILPHGRQGDLDEQALWRATRAVVFVVINAANGEGLFAQEVLERAMTTIFPKNSGGRVQDTIVENIKATVEMAKADHRPEGWTMVRLLAAVTARF